MIHEDFYRIAYHSDLESVEKRAAEMKKNNPHPETYSYEGKGGAIDILKPVGDWYYKISGFHPAPKHSRLEEGDFIIIEIEHNELARFMIFWIEYEKVPDKYFNAFVVKVIDEEY